jgi:cell pole-organizing protein PopZ
MSENRAEEPSMEEILASIRRIISEDGAADEAEPAPAPKAAKPAPKPQPVAEPEPEAEVDFEPVPAAEPEPEPEPEIEEEEEAFVPDEDEEDILDLTEKVEDEPEAEPLFEEQKRRMQASVQPVFEEEDEDEGLVSPPKREEAVSAFANLTSSLEARHPELPIGAGHKTLESLTKEVMRPMLKEWLDKNLPHIVERLVREEIERIARQGQRHPED